MDNKDNNGNVYKDASKDLVQKFLKQEWCKSPETSNVSFLQQKIWKNIYSDLHHNKEIFVKYLSSTLHHRPERQHQDVPGRLEEIEDYYNAWKQRGLCVLIQKVLQEFKESISFETTTKLYFLLAENYLWHAMREDALHILDSIQEYEKYLSTEQQQRLSFLFGETYYFLWKNTRNKEYFTRALRYIISPINKENLNKIEYETMLNIEANIYLEFEDYHHCLLTLQEYFTTFPNKNIGSNTEILASMLCIQWTVYMEQRQYANAINSFKAYLKYNPNDEITKQHIAMLAKKKSK